MSSRRSSLASVNSATGLLRHDSARRGTASADIIRTQSAPKRLFVVNDAATSPSTPRSASHLKGSKYGAMGSPPRGPPLSARAAPRTPTITSAASVPPSLQTSYTQRVQARRQDSQPSPRPLPVPFTNPFLDTLPRNGTPETMVSTTAYQFSRPASQISWSSHTEQYRPLVPLPGAPYAGMNLVNNYPYMVPPITRSYSPDSMYSSQAGYPHYGHYALSPEGLYAHPEIKTTGAKLRTHTATPHSIHSVAPSMDLTDGSIPRTLPQAAHIRGDSDPVYRSYSASPRLYPTEQSYPNPFPLVSQAEVRRFGSVPSVHYHAGHDRTRSDEIRNAAHLAGALGRTPPRSETAVTNPGQWKQLVLSAATGRSI
ncbi:hypothetical protein PHLCEN_2v4523 [Hermanssonia centrifuga]|uniref:Uncharacterized protein n=1 Tax=Hermanssonia centrifuga TaxID=98765 RepID=A0A2R6PNB0_9APHY|nr:hypothetical protein PHLCEN_2v4523 [Hermanssonia centrifuga]